MKIKEIQLLELKDMVNSDLQAIREIRNKSWQLSGVFVLIQSYLISRVIEMSVNFSIEMSLFFLSIPFSAYTYYKVYGLFSITNLVFVGMSHTNISEDDKIDDYIDYYKRASKHNDLRLFDYAKNYQGAIRSLVGFIIVAFVTVLIWIIQRYLNC